MFHRIPLSDWQSMLIPENPDLSAFKSEDVDWKAVTVPHNWQDYHGYRGISHGDLHGTARYRCFVAAGSARVPGHDRVRLIFEGVAGTAKVYVNGHLVGQHVGTFVGFTLDATEAWRETDENIIEVESASLAADESQPFFCGGCKGTPFSEGAQPLGVFRPVHLLTIGPLQIEPNGIYIWCEELKKNLARLRLRYEIRNADKLPQSGHFSLKLFGPEKVKVLSVEVPFRQEAGVLRVREINLPDLRNPRCWSPEDPFCYKIVATIKSEDGQLWDHLEIPCGLRRFDWPTIAEPDADRDVRSPDKRGKRLDDGLAEPADTNNFHNVVLKKDEGNGNGFVPGSIRVSGSISKEEAVLRIETKLKHPDTAGDLSIMGELTNDQGTVFYHQFRVDPTSLPQSVRLKDPRLWQPNEPYLYRLTLELIRESDRQQLERIEVRLAMIPGRSLMNAGAPQYDVDSVPPNPVDAIPDSEKVFRVNGEPVFLNGTCAYETLLGGDYGWGESQIESLCSQFLRAGFNAFRDGHLPHALHTYSVWDRKGVLCWTQMGSHLYFDNESFRENTRQAVRTWVRERRNHPSIFAWGIQNESIFPEAFARELCSIIREEDPTTGRDRFTTTCNGGKGSEWNVPQEWSGTYGGNCNDFDLERAQLVGEYGSWRELGVHADKDYEGDENDFTESWACFSLGKKLHLALENRKKAMGLFQWPLVTFPNPGRSIERREGPGQHAISPVNSKGLFTAWLQPTDAYYLYQSALSNPVANPMVYIVSHSWPRRWNCSGSKDRVLVYSNCEEVELFNDVQSQSLGLRHNPGPGRPFRWDAIPVHYGLLYAEGRSKGRVVARDLIRLEDLPEAPGLSSWISPQNPDPTDLPANCLRLNCGGLEYIDQNGHRWVADTTWTKGTRIGSLSWGHDFGLESADLASMGNISDPVRKTREQALYRTFRYGRHRLRFRFDVPAGSYRLHIGLFEPWYGIGSQHASFAGWRQFDVAMNGVTLLQNVDPWSLTGCLEAGVESVDFHHPGGCAEIHFPTIASGQALLAWLALEPIQLK